MTRAHLYAVATDPAGNAQENAVIRLLQPGTTTLIAAPIYGDDTSVVSISNPFTSVSGQISVYLDTPQRVRIGIAPVGAVERFIEDIDVGAAGGGSGDSDHVGSGSGSTRVGLGSTSIGAGSLAIGQLAASAGNNGTAAGYTATAPGLNGTALGNSAAAAGERGSAVGYSSTASALSTTAVGAGATSSSTYGSAVGDNAVTNSIRASAFGANATGGHDHATAVGSEAVTTEANQVMLGTSADFAEAPGGLVITAVDGKRARLRMQPDGSLTTVWHVPSTSTNLLPATEQDFETTIGAWATVSGLTSVAQSTDYAFAGTKSMKAILSGTGAASARSSKVAATVATVYVGRARMFYHVGAMTSGLNGTCWLEFYDAGNALIGTATVGRSVAFYADAWISFDVRAVAPALTATVALRVGLPTGGGVSTNVFYVDNAGIFAVPGSV